MHPAARSLSRFLFSHKGRAGNAAYLAYQVCIIPVLKLFLALQGDMSEAALSGPRGVVIALIGCFILWTYTAVLFKRMHDFNVSAWWWLAAVAGAFVFPGALYVVAFAFVFIPGSKGANRFGPRPLSLRGLISLCRVLRLERDFAGGKMSAEEFNAKRALLTPAEDKS
jgi:uncharacterized membrane protein YhaH (DUF805 family)